MAVDFGASAIATDSSAPSGFAMSAGSTIHAFTVWLYVDTFDSAQLAFSNNIFILLEDLTSGTDGWGYAQGDVSGTNTGIVFTQGGNSGDIALGVSTGGWYHALAVFDQANTTLQLYIDNVQKFSDTSYADTSAITTPEMRLSGGFNGQSNFFDGKMADAALLSAVPDAAQRAALAAGISPLLVMPDDILGYWPLIINDTTLNDKVGGAILTKSGTFGVFEHPAIIHPSPQHIMGVPSVVITANFMRSMRMGIEYETILVDVTPDDDNNLANIGILYIGTTGDVKVTGVKGGTVTLKNVPSGTWLNFIRVIKVFATGTTATNIVLAR